MTAATLMFCKSCGYNLAALPENRCPECGRPFEPANPKSFARRPPTRAATKWAIRLTVTLLLLVASAAGAFTWLRHDWKLDNDGFKAATRARQVYPAQLIGRDRIAPDWVAKILGQSNQHLLDRVTRLQLKCHPITDEEIDGLKKLHHLKDLTLYYVRLTDDRAAFLHDLTELRALNLLGNFELGDQTLAHLRDLPRLHTLKINGKHITDEGMRHIARIKTLENLELQQGRIGPRGLACLESLPRLKALGLGATTIDNDAIVHLRRCQALEELDLQRTTITPACLDQLAQIPTLKKLRIPKDMPVHQFSQKRPEVAVKNDR